MADHFIRGIDFGLFLEMAKAHWQGRIIEVADFARASNASEDVALHVLTTVRNELVQVWMYTITWTISVETCVTTPVVLDQMSSPFYFYDPARQPASNGHYFVEIPHQSLNTFFRSHLRFVHAISAARALPSTNNIAQPPTTVITPQTQANVSNSLVNVAAARVVHSLEKRYGCTLCPTFSIDRKAKGQSNSWSVERHVEQTHREQRDNWRNLVRELPQSERVPRTRTITRRG